MTAAATDSFGYSLPIHGDYAMVGAGSKMKCLGRCHCVELLARLISLSKQPGYGHNTEASYQRPLAEDRFGFSVSIQGDYAIVGAVFEDETPAGGTAS
ncbi:MAG: hypothetical protein IPH78_08860 [Bacteroidetes bacterium]|nr:hypothetical protein [Bacteroidota bacterium]